MTIAVTLYDTSALLGLYREVPAPSSYFRDLGFPGVVTFEDEYVDFEKIREGRKLAPLVVPTAQGRPVYSEASTVTRLKPAYLKPKDPVSMGRVMKKRPGENLFAPSTQSPQQRYNAIIGDILRVHRATIDRREEWMAARALIDGKVTLEGPDYPTRVVDFQRAANHTVTLSGGALWSASPTVDIMGDIQTWIDRIRRAPFGGPVNRLTVGANVIGYMLKNEGVLKQLDTQVRGTNADLNTGLRSGGYVERIGRLGPNIELYVNSDFYELPDGTAVPYLEPNRVLLSGPNIDGVRCFGAILDSDAAFRPLAVFPKMWKNEDPAATFVMSQSAPLPVPVNPNNTLAATVL